MTQESARKMTSEIITGSWPPLNKLKKKKKKPNWELGTGCQVYLQTIDQEKKLKRGTLLAQLL